MNIKGVVALPWWSWVVGGNILMIAVTAFFPYIHHDFLKWIVFNHLNLAGEMTLAAWWSGILFLVVGLLAYEQASQEQDTRLAWSLFALLFVCLSFDELGSLHERLSSTNAGWVPLLPFALPATVVTVYAIRQLWRHAGHHKQHRQSIVLFAVGLLLIASAAPNEYLEHHLRWPYLLQGPRLAFEEGLELTGILLCLAGVVRQRQLPDGLCHAMRLLPNPHAMPHLPLLLVVGFVFHLIIAIIVVQYVHIGFRGNPAIWYMSVVLFITALACAWNGVNRVAGRQRVWWWLALYFALFSAASVYAILPRVNSKLLEIPFLSNVPLLLGSQFLLLLPLYFWLCGRPSSATATLLNSMVALLILGWYSGGELGNYDMAGVFALVWATVILQAARKERRKLLGSPWQAAEGTQGVTHL